jgi:hypothetical protein
MKRTLYVSIGLIAVAMVLIIASCRKINMATDLAQGLIPPVDHIRTFDTTLEIETYSNIFLTDTLKTSSSLEQVLGRIDNDPIFGKTDARMYFQIGPPSDKYYFPNTSPHLYLDSAVLIVTFVNSYGDSSVPQTINVSEISQSAGFTWDSLYDIRNNNFPISNFLGSATVVPHTLNDSLYMGNDTTKSALNLRIKLNDNFGRRLLDYDSTNAYISDSTFKEYFKGFALQSTGGNALMGFDLSGSGLQLYYRYDVKDSIDKMDTTTAFFSFSSSYDAVANYIGRDYSATQIPAISNDNVADQMVYIQNNPGTYALLKIPGLAGMNNCIVHLAELQAEQIYDPDTIFTAPNLFLDAKSDDPQADTSVFHIPFIFNEYIDNSSGYYQITSDGLFLFGSMPHTKEDLYGNKINYWRFNLTRYVQNIVNQRKPVYDMRLYAKPGITLYDTLVGSGGSTAPIALSALLNYYSSSSGSSLPIVGKGRVRLGGGLHPTQKMKLRIVYSKIN